MSAHKLTCPKCMNESLIEIRYENGEENSFCKMCGYTRNFSVVVEKLTKIPMMENGEHIYEETEMDGYGIFFMRANGQLQVGPFQEPLTDEEAQEAIRGSGSGYTLLYLTRFEDGEVEVLYNEEEPELRHILQMVYG